MKVINNGFSEKIANGEKLQEMFENQKSENNFLEPTRLVDEVANIIRKISIDEPNFVQLNTTVFLKKTVPTKQLLHYML